MSTDGGRSFHAIATNAGWDYHAIWWSADGKRIVVGCDEGVIASSDGGAHFWQPYDLPFAQPYHVGLGPLDKNYRVCIGLQDDNSWCGPSAPPNGIGVMNRDWYQVVPGDGMWAVIDPKDLGLVWSSSTNSDTGQIYLWNAWTKQALTGSLRSIEWRACSEPAEISVRLGHAHCVYERRKSARRRQRRL